MRKQLVIFLLPALLCADDLKSLLDFATSHNKIVLSKSYIEDAKQRDIDAKSSEYYPSLSLGASYKRFDDRSPFTPGDIYSAFANVGFDIYDGGRKSSQLDQNRALHRSAGFDTNAYKKELQLQIVEDFFNIKSLEASLEVLQEQQVQLQAEVKRVEHFYEVGSTTKDDVDKLQAAYSNNSYQIEATKYQILALKKMFGVKIGTQVNEFTPSYFREPTDLEEQKSDAINALEQNANSLEFTAKSLDSLFYPTIRIEDTYSFSGYGRTDATHPEGVANQNVVLVTLNMKLFDFGTTSQQQESIVLQKKALQQQAEYMKDIQNTNILLAKSKIETTKAQIQSAKSSLESAQSAYETIAQKYRVGSIDNVAYLDALSVKTNAKAQYQTALNNLQIAYAEYYYYTNNNIQEYIK